MIAQLHDGDHRLWDEHIQEMTLALNTSVSSMGFTPAYLTQSERILQGALYDEVTFHHSTLVNYPPSLRGRRYSYNHHNFLYSPKTITSQSNKPILEHLIYHLYRTYKWKISSAVRSDNINITLQKQERLSSTNSDASEKWGKRSNMVFLSPCRCSSMTLAVTTEKKEK